MSLTILLSIGVLVTIFFHFVGKYASATKIVWVALILIWAGIISIATSEIKPKGYNEIKKMKGKYPDTDKLIEEAMPEVSVYELIEIKSNYLKNKKKK